MDEENQEDLEEVDLEEEEVEEEQAQAALEVAKKQLSSHILPLKGSLSCILKMKTP